MEDCISLHSYVFYGLQSVEGEECVEDVKDGFLTDVGSSLAKSVEKAESEF